MFNLLNSWCPHLSHSKAVSPEAPEADLCSSVRAPLKFPHKTRAPHLISWRRLIGCIRRIAVQLVFWNHTHVQYCSIMFIHFQHVQLYHRIQPYHLSKQFGRLGGLEQLEDHATQLIVTLTRPLLLKGPLVILEWCVLWPGIKSG